MIKGLMALFTSGIIFHPMVMLGILFGLIEGIWLDLEQILALYKNWAFALLVILVALLYNFTLNQRFLDDGISLDYKQILKNTLTSVVAFYFSSICGGLFVNFIII